MASCLDCLIVNSRIFKVSRTNMFYKKDALQNFAKLAGKHLCHSLFFNKVMQPEVCNSFKEETLAGVFSVNFAKFFKSPFFIERLRWLLLNFFQRFYQLTSLDLLLIKARDFFKKRN